MTEGIGFRNFEVICRDRSLRGELASLRRQRLRLARLRRSRISVNKKTGRKFKNPRPRNIPENRSVPRSRGGGGSRTRVQTRNPRAFYTLSRRLILLPRHGMRQPNRGPSFLIFARRTKRPTDYPQMNDTPYEEPLKSGTSLRDTRRKTAWGRAIKPIFLEN